MSNSRARILTSIRQSLASAKHLPIAPSGVIPPQLPITNNQLLIDQFATELHALNGQFLTVPLAEVAPTVARLLQEREQTRLLAWDAEHLPVPGLLGDLAQRGFTCVDAHLPHTEPDRARRVAEVEQVRVGLTGAHAVLADTGTLAVYSGPGRPRLASLSVRTHIALFTPQQLYASWGAWWASHSWETHPAEAEWDASNLTLISGPSRTADIEMTLTLGVHGPREVVAVLCQPDMPPSAPMLENGRRF